LRQGRVAIQDEASQLVVDLVMPQEGQRVLDLCAAPGVKAGQIAQMLGRGTLITCDRSASRLRTMARLLPQWLPSEVRLMAVRLDATQALPFGWRFQRILLDAPCSGTGTLARNPEIRARLRAEVLREFHARQVAMLRSALARLEDGGRLVYSTCSLEREENEDVVADVLRGNAGYRRVSRDEMISAIEASLADGADAESLFDEDGNFRTSPPRHQTDGFFAAAIEKIR